MTNLQSEDWDFLGPDPAAEDHAVKPGVDQGGTGVKVKVNDGKLPARFVAYVPDQPDPDPALPWPYLTGEPDLSTDFDIPGDTAGMADLETIEAYQYTDQDVEVEIDPQRRSFKMHTKAIPRAETAATDENGLSVQDRDRVTPDRQQIDKTDMLLIEEYVKDWSISQAGLRAGLGDTPKSAYAAAYYRLHKPAVKAEIQRIRAEVADRVIIDKTRVLEEYAKLAFFSLHDILDRDGKVRPLDEIGESLAAVAGIEIEELRDADGAPLGQVKKLKLTDRKAALDSIAKMLGYNEPDKLKVAGLVATLPAEVTTEQLEQLAALYAKSNT